MGRHSLSSANFLGDTFLESHLHYVGAFKLFISLQPLYVQSV